MHLSLYLFKLLIAYITCCSFFPTLRLKWEGGGGFRRLGWSWGCLSAFRLCPECWSLRDPSLAVIIQVTDIFEWSCRCRICLQVWFSVLTIYRSYWNSQDLHHPLSLISPCLSTSKMILCLNTAILRCHLISPISSTQLPTFKVKEISYLTSFRCFCSHRRSGLEVLQGSHWITLHLLYSFWVILHPWCFLLEFELEEVFQLSFQEGFELIEIFILICPILQASKFILATSSPTFILPFSSWIIHDLFSFFHVLHHNSS